MLRLAVHGPSHCRPYAVVPSHWHPSSALPVTPSPIRVVVLPSLLGRLPPPSIFPVPPVPPLHSLSHHRLTPVPSSPPLRRVVVLFNPSPVVGLCRRPCRPHLPLSSFPFPPSTPTPLSSHYRLLHLILFPSQDTIPCLAILFLLATHRSHNRHHPPLSLLPPSTPFSPVSDTSQSILQCQLRPPFEVPLPISPLPSVQPTIVAISLPYSSPPQQPTNIDPLSHFPPIPFLLYPPQQPLRGPRLLRDTLPPATIYLQLRLRLLCMMGIAKGFEVKLNECPTT